MGEIELAFHKRWLGMLEPIEGLVVSLPVLVEAECMHRQEPALSQRLADKDAGLTRSIGVSASGQPRRTLVDLDKFLNEVLGLTPAMFARDAELPRDLELYVPEGSETLRPARALKKRGENPPATREGVTEASTPQSRAGEPFVMLVGDLPDVPLDMPDRREGHWAYPPAAKFDRLLRACRVPIGLLTNREEIRLIYAPHGESTGALTFRVGDLAAVGGRDVLDAFVMLLSATRFFGVAKERQLPALLRESRVRQADVTTALAGQVSEALGLLLRGFARAAERDGAALLDVPLARGGDYAYGGLLTVLLRLVFLLYAEDRGLLPTADALYATDLSLLSLFGQLQAEHGAFPDTMARRFGAWPRLLAVFRAVYFGARWGTVVMPPRRGELFDPTRYPFLEGWGPDGGAPKSAKDRAALRVPTIDDETIFRVLHGLLVLDGQRLSYRALDVEQIGSIYEGLIGYRVQRLDAPAVCLKPGGVWTSATACRAAPPSQRANWLHETADVPKSIATKLAAEVTSARGDESVLRALESQRVKGTERRGTGEYVLQPGAERRRTSAHYTPKSLTSPIVAKTLEPILRVMGDAPSSEQLLALKVCDPAMGSGAFLVEGCRFLGDHVVAAWSREGKLAALQGKTDDVVLHARRLVAQRCLYGVDLNPFAVTLARLSLWLVTLAKDAPFTFVDHALRHGDSLVGLTIDQLRVFHWTPPLQLELTSIAKEVETALEEARGYRERILDLAEAGAEATEEKESLLRDAEFALERARTVGDLVVGAFFAHEKDKNRERARTERLAKVRAWLDGDAEVPEELRRMRAEARAKVTPFHWSIEFPEVFYTARPDPLEQRKVNGAAFMDAFIGNPPFKGGSGISGQFGNAYRDWLPAIHDGAHGNSDLCAHFFRRCWLLLGTSGTLGLVASNTIAQGDTRSTGLATLLREGGTIYDATRSMPWGAMAEGGESNVAVSVVHVAKGSAAARLGPFYLDGVRVKAINSRLRAGVERPEAVRLAANASLSFLGSKVYGQGFTLTPDARDALIRKSKKNDERIFPYIGGEEVNTHPTQDFERYVINFGTMTLEQAQHWPDLLAIVRENVKPERDKNNRENYRRLWWQFGEGRPGLCKAIAPLARCLVNSQVSKYLVFAFQPTDRVFAHTLNICAFEDHAHFAVLQSRIHEPWARLLSSTMRNDLRYAASDCFETFPFPCDDALGARSATERAGNALYETRAEYMIHTHQGLTQTYNKQKDQLCMDASIVELRRLDEAMDRAILGAYNWDIAVPPYGTPASDDEQLELDRFNDAVINRLFALNAERADDERHAGLTKAPSGAEIAEGDDAYVGSVPDPSRSRPRIKPTGPKKTHPSVPPVAPARHKVAGGRGKR